MNHNHNLYSSLQCATTVSSGKTTDLYSGLSDINLNHNYITTTVPAVTTHAISPNNTIYNSYTVSNSGMWSIASQADVDRMNKNFSNLMKFLIMKGIIKDEDEFKEFVEAIDVADNLAEKNKKVDTFGYYIP